MVVEKASSCAGNQSPSGKDYFTELAFLGLGDILYEIAAISNKHGDIKSPDDEGGNIKSNTENRKPSTAAILLKDTVRK